MQQKILQKQRKKFPHAIGNFFAELLFPPSCFVCKRMGTYICMTCYEAIGLLPHSLCPHCEVRLPFGVLSHTCKQVLRISRLFTCADYRSEPIQKLIHTMKYRYAFSLAPSLAALAVYWLKETGYNKILVAAQPLVVPVPSHKKKLRQRGFNPAALIARSCAEELNLAYSENALQKIRVTPPQAAAVNREERLQNLKDSFRADHAHIHGKTILLIDDVITTGSTMRECARTLRKAGAKEVWGLVVAKD